MSGWTQLLLRPAHRVVSGREILPEGFRYATESRKGLDPEGRRREVGSLRRKLLMGGRLREECRPTAKPKRNLRGKRLDPCRGANASPKAKADPAKMAAARKLCRRAGARSGDKCRRVLVEPGSEASLKTPCGKPCSRPCYEAANSVAAENSVGELAADLRIERLMPSTGMRVWRAPFPTTWSPDHKNSRTL